MWPLLEEVTQGFWLLVFWSWSRRSDGSFSRLEFSYETNKLIKCLVNIHSILCGTFNEGGFKLLGHILALRPRHLSVFLQVRLVCHNQHRKLVSVLYSQNLFMKFVYFLVGVPAPSWRWTPPDPPCQECQVWPRCHRWRTAWCRSPRWWGHSQSRSNSE